MKEHGTKMQTTAPDNPQSNGVAERMNRTLQERARAMMAEAELSAGGWGEAIRTTSYMRNRSEVRGLGNRAPQELWRGKVPNISHMREFGCKAYCHLFKKYRKGKMSDTAWEGVLVRYGENAVAYRVWDPLKRVVRNVGQPRFDESCPSGWWKGRKPML